MWRGSFVIMGMGRVRRRLVGKLPALLASFDTP